MNLIDIVVIFFVFFTSVSFSMKGFFNSIFSFMGWVISSFAFTKRYLFIEKQFFNEDWNGDVNIVSYIISGIIATINLWIFYYLAHKIEKVLGRTGFSEGDRILGLIFGLFFGWYFVSAIVFFIDKVFPISQLEVWRTSKLSELLVDSINQVSIIVSIFIDRWNEFNK